LFFTGQRDSQIRNFLTYCVIKTCLAFNKPGEVFLDSR